MICQSKQSKRPQVSWSRSPKCAIYAAQVASYRRFSGVQILRFRFRDTGRIFLCQFFAIF